MEKKRICIVGAGAIGGVVAGILAREGHRVSLVTKHPELAEKISTEGIRVSGFRGTFRLTIPSVASPEELAGPFHYVLMATKSSDLEEAARRTLPLLNESTMVISLQNGICEDMLAGVVGEERTVGCVVGWGGTMHHPGDVEMTSGGEFILGNWKRHKDERLEELARILDAVCETRTTDHIFPELYSKLIINSCITTLGAVCGTFLGQMLAMRKARLIFIEIIREAMAVAGAMDLQVPPGASGKLDYYRFLAPGPVAGIRRHLMLRLIGFKYRRLKSSALQSLERDRPTEVENYNGYIALKGKEHGVDTPVNTRLTSMVREIERGQRTIGLENFREIQLRSPSGR